MSPGFVLKALVTYLTLSVRAGERHDDAVFISTLTTIGCEYFDGWVVRKLRGDDFDLLTIEGDHSNVFLSDSTRNKGSSGL